MKCQSDRIEKEEDYQLKRCDLDITPNFHDYPTKKSISTSKENERFDRRNRRVNLIRFVLIFSLSNLYRKRH